MANQITVTSGTGNIQITTSRSVIGTVANVASANYANYANVANTANTAIALDANIANVSISGGTNGYVLQTDGAGNLSWTAQTGGGGNGTPGGSNTEVQFNDAGVFGGNANLTFNKTTGVLTANKIAGNGAALTNITGANVTGFVPNAVHANSATVASSANSVAGANVTGTVANATFATTAGSANTANSATIANSANSVAVANVTGIGNIATVNLDGNASNVLRGNGTFGPETASGNANYANFAGTAFSVAGANVTGTVPNANVSNFSNVVLAANYTGRLAIVNSSGNSEVYRMANVIVTEASGNASIQLGSTSIGSTGIIGNGAGLTNVPAANVTGNFTSLQVGTGSNDTLRFTPSGSNLTLSTGNVLVAENRIVTSTVPTDAVVISSGTTYTQQYFATNGSNVSTTGATIYSVDGTVGAGNAAVEGSITLRAFTGGADLANGTSTTALDVSVGTSGINVLQKVPPTGVQAGSGIIQTTSYGESGNAAAQTGLRFQRRRGNNNNRLSLEPNDYIGNIEWRAGRGGTGGSLYGTNTAKLSAKVDGAYTANTNPVPIGFELVVCNTSSTITHNFYANGNTAFAGAISATNIGNIANINLDGSSSNVLYGNGVFAPAGGSGANANYANFAGDVVNSTQSNITSVGNLVSLQVGNGSANTATTTFTPVGANITTLAGDIFVNNKRVSYDDGDAMANGAMAQDAIVVPFDSANGFGETYQMNYLVQDLANTSNVALSTNMSYNPGQYVPGDGAASGSYLFQTYTDDSDLATANPNTTLDVTLGGLGLFINPKMPNQNNGPAQTGIIGMMNYGEVSNPASATGIAFQRRRGSSPARAPVQANDYLGNITWRGAGATSGSVNSQRAVFGTKVDSAYGGGNIVPIGMEMVVVNNSNTQLTHSFYANGDVSFAGNVTATGNISTSRISNGTSNVRVSTSNGPVRIATNGDSWVEFSTNKNLVLSGVEADYANATTLQLRNGGINVLQEDLQGGFPSFAFSSYYPNTGFIAPYTFYRARGNASSPAAVQSGDAVTTQGYYVYGDSGNTYVNIGTYSATVANNDGAGNIQSRIEISTARNDNGSEVKFNSDSITLQGNTIINLNANDSNVSGNLNVTGNITYSRTFGAFYNPNAIAITANTASNLALPNVANNNNVVINSSNQITINKSGTYNIQISLQLTNSDNANEHDFDVWFAKNGTDIAYSATQYTVPKNNGKAVASLNFIDGNITAGDYFQVRYAATSANVSIEAFAAQSTPYVRPAVPSAIVTVVPVGA